MPKKHLKSFTLLELLIATVIFITVVMTVYSAFRTGLLSYRKVDTSVGMLESSRLVLNRITLDLKNVYIYSNTDSAFKGKAKALDFFSKTDYYRQGSRNTNICRLKYNFDDSILKRSYKLGLDVLKSNVDFITDNFPESIKDITFEFARGLSGDTLKSYEWVPAWPNDDQEKKQLPLAVKINIKVVSERKDDELEITRIVPLPLSE